MRLRNEETEEKNAKISIKYIVYNIRSLMADDDRQFIRNKHIYNYVENCHFFYLRKV